MLHAVTIGAQQLKVLWLIGATLRALFDVMHLQYCEIVAFAFFTFSSTRFRKHYL